MSERFKRQALDQWRSLSLYKKMYLFVGAVGIIMGGCILLNLKILNYSVDTLYGVMDANLSCYQFQAAFSREREQFEKAVRDRSQKTMEEYEQACRETRLKLELLPFDYEEVGENRYALTWNLLNSYGAYEKKRDQVAWMNRGSTDFIASLYEVYDMQHYLETYGSRLTQAVLLEGNDDYAAQLPVLGRLPYTLGGIGVIVFASLILFVRFVTKKILVVMAQLSQASSRIEKNEFDIPDVIWSGKDELGQLVKAFNKMKRSMADYVKTSEENRQMELELHRQEMERTQLEQRFSMAQLQLLKSQLNPHFLFNTLNMITRMAQMEEAPVTEEMLVAMSNLLRYSLRTTNPMAPLAEELKVVGDYMYIQKMRFGSRVAWEINCPEELKSREVPVFLFQPLVENAVIHGLSVKEEGGTIWIGIRQKENRMEITIRDTGAGMSEERLAQIRKAMEDKGRGLGIGLGNIYRRITSYYENGTVVIDSRAGEGTAVRIGFDIKEEDGRKKALCVDC